MPRNIIDLPELKVIHAIDLGQAKVKVQQQPQPPIPGDLDKKRHWLLCIVKNETQFELAFDQQHGTYLCNGRHYPGLMPTSIPPFSVGSFGCCSYDNQIPGEGAAGGDAFTLRLLPGTNVELALGWTNPIFGNSKASIVEPANHGYDAYQAAVDKPVQTQSTNLYRGMGPGYDLVIGFDFHSSPTDHYHTYRIIQQII